MAKHTPRDHVWSFAMYRALNDQKIKIKHVRHALADPPSDRTIRDVLNTMYDMEILDKDSAQAHEWEPGPALWVLERKDEQPVSNKW